MNYLKMQIQILIVFMKFVLQQLLEILKGESISKQSEIWSLGTIIFYMIFKEYSYNGKNEYQIMEEINSKK